jgi:hypothetical protein
MGPKLACYRCTILFMKGGMGRRGESVDGVTQTVCDGEKSQFMEIAGMLPVINTWRWVAIAHNHHDVLQKEEKLHSGSRCFR